MELIIAVSIAILGWLVKHSLSIRAQNKAFLNNLKNEARIIISKELKEYYLKLHKLFEEESNLLEKIVDVRKLATIRVNELTQRIRSLISSFEFRPDFILVLEEYESLFPETKEAREILQKNHADIKIHLDEIYKTFISSNDYSKMFEAIRAINGSAIAAQKWLTQDLLVIIQNITIGDFTGNKVEQWGFKGKIPVKHPRFVLDKNGKIVLHKYT